MEINKEIIASDIVSGVIEGYENALKKYIELDSIIKTLTEAKELIKSNALKELHDFNGKTQLEGYKCEIIEAGARYDFSTTKHPIWHYIKEDLENKSIKLKEVESFLKTIKEQTEILIDDEVVTLYPVPKTSTTTIKLTKLNK